jgi:hypothetical protein
MRDAGNPAEPQAPLSPTSAARPSPGNERRRAPGHLPAAVTGDCPRHTGIDEAGGSPSPDVRYDTSSRRTTSARTAGSSSWRRSSA